MTFSLSPPCFPLCLLLRPTVPPFSLSLSPTASLSPFLPSSGANSLACAFSYFDVHFDLHCHFLSFFSLPPRLCDAMLCLGSEARWRSFSERVCARPFIPRREKLEGDQTGAKWRFLCERAGVRKAFGDQTGAEQARKKKLTSVWYLSVLL